MSERTSKGLLPVDRQSSLFAPPANEPEALTPIFTEPEKERHEATQPFSRANEPEGARCGCEDCNRPKKLAGYSVAGYETFFSMTVEHLMHRLREFDPKAVVELRMEHGRQVWYKQVRQVRMKRADERYAGARDAAILDVSTYSITQECDRCLGRAPEPESDLLFSE